MIELVPAPPKHWLGPDEIVAIGFERSRVVMMNEAHHRFLRSVRTREVGRRVLPTAHRAGVRHLALEALFGDVARHANEARALPEGELGYLSQPDLRSFVEAALTLGWTLVPYDVWPASSGLNGRKAANGREEQQARNLVDALERIPDDAPLFVWCGNDHHARHALDDWVPMGVRFAELSGIEPFAINQTRSVEFPGHIPAARPWVEAYADVLARLGGAAGFLAEDAPTGWTFPESADAFVIAADNRMS